MSDKDARKYTKLFVVSVDSDFANNYPLFVTMDMEEAIENCIGKCHIEVYDRHRDGYFEHRGWYDKDSDKNSMFHGLRK